MARSVIRESSMFSLRNRRGTIVNGNKNVVDARGDESCGALTCRSLTRSLRGKVMRVFLK